MVSCMTTLRGVEIHDAMSGTLWYQKGACLDTVPGQCDNVCYKHCKEPWHAHNLAKLKAMLGASF